MTIGRAAGAGNQRPAPDRVWRRQGDDRDVARFRRPAPRRLAAGVRREMKLLLDTHALLWWREGSRRLGPRARAAIETGAASVHVSAASAWELAIKSRLRKLKLREPLDRWLPAAVESSGFLPLSVTLPHAILVGSLPDHHADPFDRMLIAQAVLHELTIVTADAVFEDYEVQVLDART